MSTGMDPERERVGRERMDAYISASGQLHAETMALTMAIGFAGSDGYSDESLGVIERDCRDIITAAHALAHLGRRFAREWHAQRIAAERQARS